MPIRGFQGTSLLDCPGHISSIVFWGGCNLRCPFCHNAALVSHPEQLAPFSEDDLLATLRERIPFVDAVVMSGGEPTIAPELPAFLRKLRALPLHIKLDTNGLRPEVLKMLLEEGLIDSVALDVKTSPERYTELGGKPEDASKLRESIRLVLELPETARELRTTCVPGLVTEREIESIGKLIEGASCGFLQQFAAEHAMEEALRLKEPYSREAMLHLAERARRHVPDVRLRGVEA